MLPLHPLSQVGHREVVSCSLCRRTAPLQLSGCSAQLFPLARLDTQLSSPECISQQMTRVSREGRWPGALASLRGVQRASPRQDRMGVFRIWVPDGPEVQSSPRGCGEHSPKTPAALLLHGVRPVLQHGSHSTTHLGLVWSPVQPPFLPPISWSQAQSSASDCPGSNSSSFTP